MAYNLLITERANELIDRTTAYLIHHLKNPDAASHFLDELDAIYLRLEENPFQFAESKDEYLRMRGYREAFFQKMNYHLVFRVAKQSVYVLGIFHTLEDYARKLD